MSRPATGDTVRVVPDRSTPAPRPGPRLDRIAVGILLAAGGTAWLLDIAGVPVPWRMFPAVALMVVGLALVTTVRLGHGRGPLIAVGVALLAVAVAVGLDIDRYAGPVGDRVLAPMSGSLPADTRIGVGSVVVDLTQGPLPTTGRTQVQVGVGTVVVLLPPGPAVGLDAEVVTGSIVVDRTREGDGVDVHWSEEPGTTGGAVLSVQVGVGEIEVQHRG